MVRWKHTLFAVATVAALAAPLAQATDPLTDPVDTSATDEVFDVNAWVEGVSQTLDAQLFTDSATVPADCPDQRDPGAVAMADKYYVKVAKQYDGTLTLSLYGETNTLPGLQTWWTICDPDASPIPPDNKVASADTDKSLIW